MMARHEEGIGYVQGSSRVFLPTGPRRMNYVVILAFNEGSKEKTPKQVLLMQAEHIRPPLQTFS